MKQFLQYIMCVFVEEEGTLVVDNNMNYQRTCLLCLEHPTEVFLPDVSLTVYVSHAFLLHHICIDAYATHTCQKA